MKKAFILFVIPLFFVAGNVAAVNLNGIWEASSDCYGINAEDSESDPEYPEHDTGTTQLEFTQNEDFIYTKSIVEGSGPAEYCYGVIAGNNISLTCLPSEANEFTSSFGHGEIKGKTIYYTTWCYYIMELPDRNKQRFDKGRKPNISGIASAMKTENNLPGNTIVRFNKKCGE